MDKAYWRLKLRELQAELIALDADATESRQAVELDQSRVGRLSRMDAIQGQAMNNAIAERRKQTLIRIEAALGRLDEDEFGYCLKCGDEIARERLELDPAVTVCTGCSTI